MTIAELLFAVHFDVLNMYCIHFLRLSVFRSDCIPVKNLSIIYPCNKPPDEKYIYS